MVRKPWCTMPTATF